MSTLKDQAPGELDHAPMSEDQVRRRHKRSVAIAIALFGLVVLFFVMTLVRLGGNVADRPL